MPFKSREERRDYDREVATPKRRKRGRPPLAPEDKKIYINMRVPLRLSGRIDRLVAEGMATGRYPWKSRTEAWQWLAQRGIEQLAERGDEIIDEMLPYLRITHAADSIATHRKEAMSFFSSFVTETREFLAAGGPEGKEAAVRHYHAMMHMVAQMPEHFWRDHLMKRMKRQFPKLAALPMPEIRLSNKPVVAKRRMTDVQIDDDSTRELTVPDDVVRLRMQLADDADNDRADRRRARRTDA